VQPVLQAVVLGLELQVQQAQPVLALQVQRALQVQQALQVQRALQVQPALPVLEIW
jgi:hypothetical protein